MYNVRLNLLDDYILAFSTQRLENLMKLVIRVLKSDHLVPSPVANPANLRNRPHNWSLCRQHLTLYKLPELLASPSTCTTSQYVSMSRKRPSSSYSCPFVVCVLENFSDFSLFVDVTALVFAI